MSADDPARRYLAKWPRATDFYRALGFEKVGVCGTPDPMVLDL